MLRKIFKTGNSVVVSLPREMLENLGVGDGSEVSVELNPVTRLSFAPSSAPCRVLMKFSPASWPNSSRNTGLRSRRLQVNDLSLASTGAFH
jgi:hypothetical protein